MNITFIGGGNMANALIGGLLKQGFAAAGITVIEPLAENRERLSHAFGITCRPTADAAISSADVLVLAVKPQQMQEALTPLSGTLSGSSGSLPLVISIAAGVRTSAISRWLGGYGKLVRAMPNTPALIGAGITGLYAGPLVDAAGRRQAEQVLGAAGATLWVDDESMMDAVTAVSGSGPAYVFYFIESLRDAALALGFSADQAKTLAIETVTGAAALASGSAEDVAVLRQRVTSKGGTTEAALASLHADDFKAAILRAVRAAEARGRELGGPD
ncbi:MAG: pyrroline-5-carboxylate reductase [Zoogloeaceae bacterium]|jgi:pyrroline-5-carboxylate reductase|nr:pyrroline-5-carboxylate reductase [Zoogloeaceae bacterium]